MKKLDKEIVYGGVAGGVAIVAILIEVILGRFSVDAIVGGIKDLAGTVVAVLVFAVAYSGMKKKNVKGFGNVFRSEMERVITKYDPAIIEFKDDPAKSFYRCDIATNLDCIGGAAPGAYHLFFRIDNENQAKTIAFKVTKTVFGDYKGEVAESIISKLLLVYRDEIEKVYVKDDFVTIEFSNTLTSDEDAILLADIVDCVLLVGVAKYRVKK